MANPFFSGRIPQELFDKIEQHCKETELSKTDILLQALCQYFDFPLETIQKGKSLEINEEKFNNLENRIKILEETVESLTRNNPIKRVDKEENLDTKTSASGHEIYENINTTKLCKLTNITRRVVNKFIEESVELIKAKGEEVIPDNFFKEPILITHKENILVKEYPYKVFYRGENSKGQPMWNLIPDDNACYQTVISEI